MQQLLQITTVPIEYRYNVEPSRLEYNQSANPQADVSQRPARLNLDSKNIQVRIDTMDMRRSLGFQTNGDRAREGAQKGQENIKEFIRNQESFGKQVSQIQDGVTIGQIFRQKVKELPSTYMVFLPSQGPSISWMPNKLDVEYQSGDIKTDWEIARNRMQYVRGRFEMDITQYPKVNIQYIGDPIYIPRSADPNYVEPSE